MTTTVQEAGEELGKSLAKILYSEKYTGFDYTDLIQIMVFASNTAIEIIEKENSGGV